MKKTPKQIARNLWIDRFEGMCTSMEDIALEDFGLSETRQREMRLVDEQFWKYHRRFLKMLRGLK